MKSIFVLLILFCLYQGQDANSGCPGGFIRFADSDRCYYVSSNYDTYEEAKKFCESRNSLLVPPIACASQMTLNLLMASLSVKCRKGQYCEDFWIGIHKLSGNNWQSTAGVELDKNSKCLHWDMGFPSGDGRCAYMSYEDNIRRGSWRNDDCNRKRKYICITCPDGFDYLPEVNQCIFLITRNSKWHVARHICYKKKWGAELLTIKSPFKQKVIERYLPRRMSKMDSRWCHSVKSNSMGKVVWTGGQTKDSHQCRTPYYWKPLVTPVRPFTYSNWLPGVPNCGVPGESCAAITNNPFLSFRWDDLHCMREFCSLCEF